MARIAGIQLPADKRIDYALTLLYGIGWPASRKILGATAIDPGKRVENLTDEELAKIAKEIEGFPIEGELRRQVGEDIKRLIAISAYRGVRHTKNLPVRGQRTRTNARTKRGKRKTIGAFKKETLAKMQQQRRVGDGKKE